MSVQSSVSKALTYAGALLIGHNCITTLLQPFYGCVDFVQDYLSKPVPER